MHDRHMHKLMLTSCYNFRNACRNAKQNGVKWRTKCMQGYVSMFTCKSCLLLLSSETKLFA